VIRIKVKWDFSEFTSPKPEDVLGTTISLKNLGYSWDDVSDVKKAVGIHNAIAKALKLPLKLDVLINLEELIDLNIEPKVYVSNYLTERFGCPVDSWERIED
jgi:hypothetical protein